MTTPSVQPAAECFCDRTGLGVKGVTCGDCPRDYAQQPAAAGVVRYAWNDRIERYLSPSGSGTGLLPVVRASDYDALQAKVARLEAALDGLVTIIDKAGGPLRLSNAVELGPVSWCVKANDAMFVARAALQGAARG